MKESAGKPIGLIVLALGTLLLILGANAWKSGLRANHFVVEGNRIVPTNEIVQLMEVQQGVPLYKTDLTGIQRSVESHFYIRQAIVERDPPNTIRVRVQERVPIAMLNREGMHLIDAEGMVLPHTDSRTVFDLPMVSGIPDSIDCSPGKVLTSSDVQDALEILLALKIENRELYHRISEVDVRRGGDIVLYAAEDGVPILFGRGNVANKLVRLETFWYTTVIARGVQRVKYVDVRYDDQIIVQWNDGSSTRPLKQTM